MIAIFMKEGRIIDYLKITNAAILCGGKSRRMGFDKAFIQINEQYLMYETIQTLSQIFQKILLITDNIEKFENIKVFNNYDIIQDIYIHKGPLAAISTALSYSPSEYTFCMACDMPQPNIKLIQNMYTLVPNNQVVLCGYKNQIHPLFAFYHQSCLEVFKKSIQENNLKIRNSFNQLQVSIYWMNKLENESILNMNTPEELNKWHTDHKITE